MSDYPSSARTAMLVSLKDIQEAFEFVCAGGGGEHEAFLCRQSGKLYCHSELCDDLDILPDDIGDSARFLQIPDKREFDLGKSLAWTSPANSCPATSTTFYNFSAEGAPTKDSRIYWIEG